MLISLQVKYSETNPSVLANAARLGAGRAQPALQLVGFEQDVEAAIKYTFGQAFVCQVRRAWSIRALEGLGLCQSLRCSSGLWVGACTGELLLCGFRAMPADMNLSCWCWAAAVRQELP